MSKVSAVEQTAIGALAGMAEVCIMQPVVGLKNALQEGRPVPRQLNHLYRGLGMGVASQAPITATQFGANAACEQIYWKLSGSKASGASQIMCATTAGAVSGVVATPAELLVIMQQKSGRSLPAEAAAFIKEHGLRPLFSRGLGMCVAREALYAGGYLGLFPALQGYLDTRPEMKAYPAGTSTLAAGLTAGFFGSFTSHPFDTVKTRQQAFMYSKPEYISSWSSIKTLYEQDGLGAFWKGYLPRGFRIICAVFVLNGVRNSMIDYLEAGREATQCVEAPSIEPVSL